MNEENKTIWIINQYASTPETGMGGRHYYLARELGKLGYRVYLIAASANHLLREPPRLDKPVALEEHDNFTFVWVKMPSYEQAHSRQRALNWLLFPWQIQKLPKVIPHAPDAILCSSPSPVAFLGAERLAKRFNARLVFEVRDIWPLTLIELGGYSPKHPAMRFMQWVEDRAYRKADRVISNLKNAVEHMTRRGMAREKFAWVPNGFSLDEVNLEAPLNKTARNQLPQDKFIIGYTGTLGVANAMDTFIEAAARLQHEADIAFVLVGDGKEKASLKQLAKSKKLDNVYFVDPIPKVEIQAMLSQFDACYIGWKKNSLYRFGIGANKIPEYLYSGRPIIHSYSGACDPVEEVKCGILIDAENPISFAEAIVSIHQKTPEQRKTMGERGRTAALEQYEYGKLAKQLADNIF